MWQQKMLPVIRYIQIDDDSEQQPQYTGRSHFQLAEENRGNIQVAIHSTLEKAGNRTSDLFQTSCFFVLLGYSAGETAPHAAAAGADEGADAAENRESDDGGDDDEDKHDMGR